MSIPATHVARGPMSPLVLDGTASTCTTGSCTWVWRIDSCEGLGGCDRREQGNEAHVAPVAAACCRGWSAMRLCGYAAGFAAGHLQAVLQTAFSLRCNGMPPVPRPLPLPGAWYASVNTSSTGSNTSVSLGLGGVGLVVPPGYAGSCMVNLRLTNINMRQRSINTTIQASWHSKEHAAE